MKARVLILFLFVGLLIFFLFSYQHMDVKETVTWGIFAIMLLQMYTIEKIGDILKKNQ
jgi:hypothetical protein